MAEKVLTHEQLILLLGELKPGELRWWMTVQGGMGGRGRDDDPDPIDVGSGPVPRYAVRLVAFEVALWTGRHPSAADVARESGLPEAVVVTAFHVLRHLFGREGRLPG